MARLQACRILVKSLLRKRIWSAEEIGNVTHTHRDFTEMGCDDTKGVELALNFVQRRALYWPCWKRWYL